MNKQPLGPLMVDIDGINLSKEDETFLQHPAVGSVILFGRNFESKKQLTNLIEQIKALRTPNLPVAVDQEGGRVQRFVNEFQRLPACFEIGKKFDQNTRLGKNLAYICGYVMATELRETGVDFSFAPVLDMANLNSYVIGDRGFHSDPEIVCLLGESYIDGMNSAGMQATGKHYPGHGGIIDDSHFLLPHDARNFKQIDNCDLIPFKHLSEKLMGIMTAHIRFGKIEHAIPAYSTFWLKQVLRESLSFNGVIFSDDLTMEGACDIHTISERTVTALSAGCDIAIICNDRAAAMEAAETTSKNAFTYNNAIEQMRGVRPKPNTVINFKSARALIQTEFF